MHIYLDESGNLIGKDGQYFIIGSYTVGDPQRIENAFRRWQRRKFPKKLKNQAEIKFNDSHISDKLRLKTIRYIARQDIRIFYAYLKRKNIPEVYRKKGKIHDTGLLYVEIVRSTLELYLPSTELQFIEQQFQSTLKTSLLPKLPAKTIFSIQSVDSASSVQVQVADWVCGALARYYEKKPLGNELYAELKRNIIQQNELFSDYWTKRWEQ